MALSDFQTHTIQQLIQRYVALSAAKFVWLFVINWSSNWWISALLPLPLTYFAGHTYVVWIPDGILSFMQAVLVIEAGRRSLLRFRPDVAAQYGIRTKDDRPTEGGGLDHSRLTRNWLTTPILMTVLVTLSVCLIGWAIALARYGPHSFEGFVYYQGQIPMIIGVVLSVLGILWGNRYTSAAKANVGGAFGVSYLAADHPLSQRVAALAKKVGLPAPSVGVVNVVNAFAMGSSSSDASVVLGLPLIKSFSDEELDAVIGHELGHIVSNDMLRMQFAEGFQSMLGNVLGIITATFTRALAQNRSQAMLGQSLGYLARSTVFVGSEMVVKGISRSREFYADAVGAALTRPEAMIGALQKLEGIIAEPTRLEQQYGYLMFGTKHFGRVFATHPSFASRVKALEDGTHIKRLPRKVAATAAPSA